MPMKKIYNSNIVDNNNNRTITDINNNVDDYCTTDNSCIECQH